jgi:hypothetical protein
MSGKPVDPSGDKSDAAQAVDRALKRRGVANDVVAFWPS